MELKFNKNGDAWVAEFEATDKFNLHMEGLLLGSFSILQRTAGGKYTHVRDIPTYPRFDKVFDYDFNALVYPKYIKIVSETEPTYAEVVSDGEITEIKSQTKEVEVTANGTTQVAPDAGYSYLTGVTVKTNVPQSGGSGGEGGGSSAYFRGVEYYAVNYPKLAELGYDYTDTSIVKPSGHLNMILNGCGGKMGLGEIAMFINPVAFSVAKNSYIEMGAEIKGIYYFNAPNTVSDNGMLQWATFMEIISASPINGVFNEAFTRITEEEFYNLG